MGCEFIIIYFVFKGVIMWVDKMLWDIGVDFFIYEELICDKKSIKVGMVYILQFICLVVQFVLIDFLELFGICLIVVIGYLLGEIGVVYVVGVLDFELVMVVVYYRGQVIIEFKKIYIQFKGSMMVVGFGVDEFVFMFKVFNQEGGLQVVVVCENFLFLMILFGDEEVIDCVGKMF